MLEANLTPLGCFSYDLHVLIMSPIVIPRLDQTLHEIHSWITYGFLSLDKLNRLKIVFRPQWITRVLLLHRYMILKLKFLVYIHPDPFMSIPTVSGEILGHNRLKP